ncbi:hypothetical protein IH601_04220, partial [Candidatus Bipolaricaulota bacterium]|nr:hypothetical protein [Candidatus Bipolaricaulota bacterium]
MRDHYKWIRLARTAAMIVLLLSAIGSLGSGDSGTTTQMEIDGRAFDWEGRAIVGTDPAGDPEGDHPDLRNAYAFLNQHALYLFVELENLDEPFSHFDIEMQAGTRRVLISWTPGDAAGRRGDVTGDYEDIGPTEYSGFELADGLEARIDLRDLGSPD